MEKIMEKIMRDRYGRPVRKISKKWRGLLSIRRII